MTPTTEITLNVYDISTPSEPNLIPTLNSYASYAGLGVFHSGVEISGTEYCFGGHDSSSTGVFTIPPRSAPDAIFRQSISMGRSNLSPRAIERVLDRAADDFQGNSYNLLTRNCNTYADAVCRELVGRGIPGWVNRLAFIGSRFQALLPAGMDVPGIAPVTAEAAGRSVRREPRGPPLTLEERRAAAAKAAVAAEVRAAAHVAGVEFDDPDHDFSR